jgi:hypothetical protein
MLGVCPANFVCRRSACVGEPFSAAVYGSVRRLIRRLDRRFSCALSAENDYAIARQDFLHSGRVDQLDDGFRANAEQQEQNAFISVLTGLLKAALSVRQDNADREQTGGRAFKLVPVIMVRTDVYDLVTDPQKTQWVDKCVKLDWVSEGGKTRAFTVQGARSIKMPTITVLYEIQPGLIVIHNRVLRRSPSVSGGDSVATSLDWRHPLSDHWF